MNEIIEHPHSEKTPSVGVVGITAAVSLIVSVAVLLLGSEGFVWMIILLSLAGVLLLSAKAQDLYLSVMIWLSVFLKTALAVFQAYVGNLPDSTADAVHFERLGWGIAESSNSLIDFMQQITTTGEYQHRYIATFYYFFGRFPMLVAFTYVIMGTALIYVVYKTVLLMGGNQQTARIAGLMTLVFPTINLYSAMLMRETIVTFFTALSIYYFLQWCHRQQPQKLFAAVITLIFGGLFHGGVMMGLFVYLSYWWFYNKPAKRIQISFPKVVLFVVGGILLYLAASNLTRKLPDISDLANVEFLANRVTAYARDRAAYLHTLVPGSLFDVLWQSPIRIIYFLYKPFPWDVRTTADVVGLLDSIMYIGLSFLMIRGLAARRGNPRYMLVVLMFILIVALTFSWSTANYGAAIRHRQKIVPLFIVNASLFWNQKKGSDTTKTEEISVTKTQRHSKR